MTTTLLTSAGDSSNTATYTAPSSGSFTPTAGDLIVVLGYGKATTTVPPAVTVTGGPVNGVSTFYEQGFQGDAGGSSLFIAVAEQLVGASPVAMTLTIDFGADSGTGCGYAILAISGMTKTGATAAVQLAGADNNLTSGATPQVVFAAPPASTNVVVGIVGNNTNPAGCTQPTGFTEQVDTGFNTPTTGIEVVSIDSGCPQTVTWGGTNASRGAVMAVELDTSGSGGGSNFAASGTVAATSATVGSPTARHAVTGTVAAVSATVGNAPANHPVSGTVAATSTTSGNAPANHPVTGAVAAVSGTSGDPTIIGGSTDWAASGTVAATSTVSGDPTANHPVSGTAAAVSGSSGSLTAHLLVAATVAAVSSVAGTPVADHHVSGTVTAASATTGDAPANHPVSGTVAAVSSTSGSPAIGGHPDWPASGTVTATSGVSGTVTADHAVTGTVAATSGATGSTTANLVAVGTAAAVSDLSGSATATYVVSGTVDAVSGTSGDPTANFNGALVPEVILKARVLPRGLASSVHTRALVARVLPRKLGE